jgi:hypothetical protein
MCRGLAFPYRATNRWSYRDSFSTSGYQLRAGPCGDEDFSDAKRLGERVTKGESSHSH